MRQVILNYLEVLGIPVSKRYFRKLVASHAEYPSLLSVCDSLEQLGIPHGVVRMDRAGLKNLAFPYVLHLERGDGELIVVNKESDLNAELDLLSDWSGIVLQAEAPESIEDEENRDHLAKERAARWAGGLFLLSALVMFTGLSFHNFGWGSVFLLATAIAGVVLGYLLIAKDLGVKYDAVESFCNANRSSNCNQVLRSDQAKLFGGFGFSDATLSYFTVQVLVIGLLVPLAESAGALWWALAAAGILTLPVVLYSLWLQAVTFKMWCRLCLLVAAVLLLQAGLFGWTYATDMFGSGDSSLWTVGLVGGLFLGVGSLVFLIKSRLKESSEAEQAEVAAKRVKYNPSVFVHLLLQQPEVDSTPFEKELLIGNPDTPVNILMAASLGCGPCKEGFEKAKQLVTRFPKTINLSVRLSISKRANGRQTDPGRYLLGYWLTTVYGTDDQLENTEKLLQDWFDWGDLNRFQEGFPLQVNWHDQSVEALVKQHLDWFGKVGIESTPTFFVNGYTVPREYQIDDLKHVLRNGGTGLLLPNETMRKAEGKKTA